MASICNNAFSLSFLGHWIYLVDKISLAEAINALRRELAAASQSAKGQDLRFQVDKVTVELEVVSEKVTQGSAGVKWVVEVGAQRSHSDGHTHRVTVELTPKIGSGRLLTGDSEIPD